MFFQERFLQYVEAVMLWETGILKKLWLFFQRMKQVKGKHGHVIVPNNCDIQIINFFFFKVSWCIFLLIFSKLITYAQRVKSFYKLFCEKQVPLFLSFDLSNNFRSWLLAASFGTNTMFLNRLMLLFLILKIFLRHCLWLLVTQSF